MASSRPGTPYYIFSDTNDGSLDPPPYYTSGSSDGSPPSSLSSPRLGQAEVAVQLPPLLRGDTTITIDNAHLRRQENPPRDVLHSSSNSASRSSLSVTDDGEYAFALSDNDDRASTSGGYGSSSGLAEGSRNSAAHTAARVRRINSAGSGLSILGNPRYRHNGGFSAAGSGFTTSAMSPMSDTEGPTSRFSSRAASPAMGASASSASSVAGSASSSTYYIHHHHYHHPSTASTTSSSANSLDGKSSSAKGKERARQLYSTPSSSNLNSSDYAVPIDGPYGSAYHYRNGPLAKKLGGAILSRDPSLTDLPLLANGSTSAAGSAAHRRRSGWKTPRNSSIDEDPSDLALHLDTSLRQKRRISHFIPFPGLVKSWNRFLRHPFVPTQPLTILFALGLFVSFAYSVTTFMYHILSTDKTPRPWRTYCQEQRPFPHDLADSLNPVDVFVGVFSVDAAYERRHLIRSTYLRHSRPIDPYTGRPGNNVQVKFILGRPRKHHARRVALEMETYNDIVVLDIRENMNQGKTHTFFRWANENATVPVYYKQASGKKYGALDPSASETSVERYSLAFKKADYVVKADDDAFLVLSELERHLRVAPRNNMYWGYLIRNLFMGGECYALSADLVNYVATAPALEAYTAGAEDKRVAKWMRMHPNASSINWVTERCYVYDHPKAATTYSHGFLFPDEVERVRAEGRLGISPAEKTRRGGDLADAWSSVSKWKKAYARPKAEMTMEEEVEALIEGGGRWTALDGWTNKISSNDVVKWEDVVFEPSDIRIKGSADNVRKAFQARSEYNAKAEMAFGKYNRMPNSLIRDPGDSDLRPQHAKRKLSSYAFWKRGSSGNTSAEDTSTAESSMLESTSLASYANHTHSTSSLLSSLSHSHGTPPHASASSPSVEQPQNHHHQIVIGAPNFKQGYSLFPDAEQDRESYRKKAIPAPQLRYDPTNMSVREKRFLGLPHGGTVVVHYLKRNEWFLETALALLGRERTWDTGLDAPAYPPHIPHPPPGGQQQLRPDDRQKQEKVVSSMPNLKTKGEVEIVSPQWGGARMYGSPLIKDSGFVSAGRTVPWDALQKSEVVKHGNMQASPRQLYADMLGEDSVSERSSSLSSSSSS